MEVVECDTSALRNPPIKFECLAYLWKDVDVNLTNSHACFKCEMSRATLPLQVPNIPPSTELFLDITLHLLFQLVRFHTGLSNLDAAYKCM